MMDVARQMGNIDAACQVSTLRACSCSSVSRMTQIAKGAFDDAIAQLDTLPEDS
jgi:hypothetical protein